jgi:hypothetical protein
MFIRRLIPVFSLLTISAYGQHIDEIIENVCTAEVRQQENLRQIYPYSFSQEILFQKLDDDGAVEEQSRRTYKVRALSEKEQRRELMKALEYEDGEWIDITAQASADHEGGEGKEFSLMEIVGPDSRKAYSFELAGEDLVNGYPAYHVIAQVKEPDEDRFEGDLWVHRDEYVVIKAVLRPSDLPVAVDTMTMAFELSKISGNWLPVKINLDAEVSFLFFFSGRIKSDITFHDYKFPSEQ